MKIIYHCYGGNHSSVTAAAVHLGKLPLNRVPTREELLRLELYDRQGNGDIGKIVYMGNDGLGNDIHVTGRRSRPKILYNMVTGLAEQFGIQPESYMLVDMGMLVNNTMRVGGVLSRRLGFIGLGRPIVAWGTIMAYASICDLVREIKYGLQNGGYFGPKFDNYIIYPEV